MVMSDLNSACFDRPLCIRPGRLARNVRLGRGCDLAQPRTSFGFAVDHREDMTASITVKT